MRATAGRTEQNLAVVGARKQLPNCTDALVAMTGQQRYQHKLTFGRPAVRAVFRP